MRNFRGRWYFFAPLVLVALTLFSLVTMLLWNSLLPQLFHFPVITFWQAVGLLILTRLLFSGGGMHHRGWHNHRMHYHLREKWLKMSPEEREKFRENIRNHRNPWSHDCCGDFKHDDKNNVQS